MTKSLLTIDVGNTHQTVALHENNELKEVRKLINCDDWMHFAGPALLSQVGPVLPMPFQHVTQLKELRQDDNLLDMPIHYSQSLGDHRLALGYLTFQNLKQSKQLLSTLILASVLLGIFVGSVSTSLPSLALKSNLPTLQPCSAI